MDKMSDKTLILNDVMEAIRQIREIIYEKPTYPDDVARFNAIKDIIDKLYKDVPDLGAAQSCMDRRTQAQIKYEKNSESMFSPINRCGK